jgi:hypothetical protein
MARHAKTDSDVTSLAPSSPPRSPRGRPAYYVLSPAASHPDVLLPPSGGQEKMSLAGSTPAESPLHYHHFHRGSGAGVHHSRESSTGRLLFSDQLRSGAEAAAAWRRLSAHGSVGDEDDEEGSMRGGPASPWRCYALGAFAFFAVFAFFLLVLWGASKSYKPHVVVKVRPSSLFSPLILLFPLLFSLSRTMQLACIQVVSRSRHPKDEHSRIIFQSCTRI